VKRKWLSIGIILLFVGIAVAPSINSGIVQASNDNGTIRSRITSQPMSISLKRLSDIFKRVDSLKHPFLYLVVFIISASRLIRGIFLIWIFLNINELSLPLLFLRGYWLVSTSKHWAKFWNDISDSQGWNWPSL
jgi:hypothetical protein